jgi:ubiquitin fusion degradation protein 1
MYNQAMLSRGGRPRRFDEYYRCYPVLMKTDRQDVIHGGKVYLPASALDKLTQLHITYPMLFELINGAKQTKTHAGVLEFTAEEGKIYLPNWIMRSLLLDPGDLLQIKSTDLPSGSFIKLQPQSPAFLDISDPKAVLENVFRSYSCLTKGDIFSFNYVDQIHEVAVLEVEPDKESHSISVQETDLSVDFAAPVGYVEPERNNSGTSTPAGVKGMGGALHTQGTMAQAINYDAIAPLAKATVWSQRKGVKPQHPHPLAHLHPLPQKQPWEFLVWLNLHLAEMVPSLCVWMPISCSLVMKLSLSLQRRMKRRRSSQRNNNSSRERVRL